MFSKCHEGLSKDFTTTNSTNLLKINIPLLGDSMFDNITTYVNDDLWKNPAGKTGIQKCHELCKGNCVQYGYTGDAMCF